MISSRAPWLGNRTGRRDSQDDRCEARCVGAWLMRHQNRTSSPGRKPVGAFSAAQSRPFSLVTRCRARLTAIGGCDSLPVNLTRRVVTP